MGEREDRNSPTIRAEQVRLLYRQAPSALLANVSAGGVAALLLSDIVPTPTLLGWFGVLVLVIAGRYVLTRRFRRRSPAVEQTGRWGQAYTATAFLAGCTWGAFGLLFDFSWPVVYQVLVVMTVSGMSAGAILSTASLLPTYAAFVFPMLLPLAVHMMLEKRGVYLGMGVLIGIYTVLTFLIARNFHQKLTASLRLQEEKAGLADILAVTNEALEREVVQRTHTEETLRRERDRIQNYLDLSQVLLVALGLDGRITLVNQKACTTLGYGEDELVGQSWFELCLPERVRDEIWPSFQQAHRDPEEVAGYHENSVLTRGGDERLIAWRNVVLRDTDGRPTGTLSSGEDITEQRETQQQLKRRDAILEGICFSATQLLNVDTWGQAIDEVLARLGQAALADRAYLFESHLLADGTPVMSQRYEWTSCRVSRLLDDTGLQGLSWDKAGLERWHRVLSRGGVIAGAVDSFPATERTILEKGEVRSALLVPVFVEGELWGFMGFDECRTQRQWSSLEIDVVKSAADTVGAAIARQRWQMKVEELAHHDALTGLPNRFVFGARMEHALQRARRANRSVALLFLDLDRFKNINDTLDHRDGDNVLRRTAQVLTSCVRGDDTVARLGGDEFTVVLEGIHDPQDVAPIAQKILDGLAEPFSLDGREMFITGSIGISLYPRDGNDATQLIKHADVAMYRAKEEGRNNYQYFTKELTATSLERLSMENSLRRAIERDELVLHYQPQISYPSGRLVGAEALIRWQRSETVLVPPGRFIPLAEETGLINPMGEWALETACTQAKAWQAAGLLDFRVAVNLSGRQITRSELAPRVERILRETGLAARYVELEITEGSIMQQAEEASRTLEALKALGLSLAIDDFGTGYSSLSYLKRFCVDKLKIDRSFVRDIPDDPHDVAIAKAVIALARSLQLRVVAEGVETPQQAELLHGEGCNEMQGFLFSKPVPAEEFERLLLAPKSLRALGS